MSLAEGWAGGEGELCRRGNDRRKTLVNLYLYDGLVSRGVRVGISHFNAIRPFAWQKFPRPGEEAGTQQKRVWLFDILRPLKKPHKRDRNVNPAADPNRLPPV